MILVEFPEPCAPTALWCERESELHGNQNAARRRIRPKQDGRLHQLPEALVEMLFLTLLSWFSTVLQTCALVFCLGKLELLHPRNNDLI